MKIEFELVSLPKNRGGVRYESVDKMIDQGRGWTIYVPQTYLKAHFGTIAQKRIAIEISQGESPQS